jgi:transposase-like protein
MAQKQERIQRWTAKRRAALVIEILRGNTSVQEAARQHGLTVAEIEQWKDSWLVPRMPCAAALWMGGDEGRRD